MNCPNCQIPLSRKETPLGLVWSCAQCDGRAVGFELLRRTVATDFMNDLWQQAKTETESNGKICPSCSLTMRPVTEQGVANPVTLDLCLRCHFLWFDAQETAELPIVPPTLPQSTDAQLTPEARAVIAQAKVEMLVEREKVERSADWFAGNGGNAAGNFSAYGVTGILYGLARWLLR